MLACLACSRNLFQATECLCVAQAAAAGVTAPADAPSGHGISHVINVHADARAAVPHTNSRHSSHEDSKDQPQPAAADSQDRDRCPSAGAFPAVDRGPTAARAPAPEGGASIADVDGAAVPSGRITYSRVTLLALCTGCSALPLGVKQWPDSIMRTDCNMGGGQAPVTALTMRRTGVMSASDAFGPSPAPRGATRPAIGLKDATRSWLQLPRELPGALVAAFLTPFGV